MKPISCILCVILITCLMMAIGLSTNSVEFDHDEPPDPTFCFEAGTKVIDRRYSPPNTYEVLYRTSFNNGLTAEIWRQVSKKEYERIKNYNKEN